MVHICFQQKDGTRRTAIVEGGSVMEAAKAIAVVGIEGQCGGSISCGTCHVHVLGEGLAITGPATLAETDMLEFEPSFGPNSRLSCQIAVTPDLDGIVFEVATT